MKKKDSKFIVLVGYRSSNGNLVPTFYFDNQEDFDSWFNEYNVSSGNLIFFKLSVPLYDDLDSYDKLQVTDFIKNPYV